MIGAILKLIRVKQWVKNLFLFIPVFFAGELFDLEKLSTISVGFMAFSLVASAIYILNDYRDIEEDKLHAEKRHRPLASGTVSKPLALSLMVILLAAGISLGFLQPDWFVLVLVIYVAMNVGYSLGLKKISVLDLIIVSFGFILRIIAGGVSAQVPISQWLVIMIFLLSLFIVVAKRRDDILEFLNSGKVLRKSIQNYNLEFINSILTMLSGIIIVAYIMYAISPEVVERLNTRYLYVTAVFVIAGLIRYLQITLVENNSGSPVNVLYRDRFIHITLLLWILSFFVIIYILKV